MKGEQKIFETDALNSEYSKYKAKLVTNNLC